MSTDAQSSTPNTRKRNRAAMQASDPAQQNTQVQQPTTDDSFVNDTEAVESAGDDDDEEGGKSDKKAGRRKIKIEFIQDKSRRHITFSKRKAGIMKKAYELSTLTGTQVLLLVVSETGLVYTFTTAKLQPLVTQPEGKNLIQACLNAPHGSLPSNMPVGTPLGRPAPQQMQSTGPPQGQPVPNMPPPSIGQRNVPGGLSIGGAGSGASGQGVEEADGDRDGREDADQEGEKRGAPRRRTSGAGKSSTNASGGQGAGGARSPTTPSTHVPGTAAQGIPSMQPPYGNAPGSAGPDGTPGHPAPPPGMYSIYPGAAGYYPPPPVPSAWAPPPQGGPAAQQAYGRR